MKVLHLFNEINFSGAELMYSDAAEYLQENGIEIYALSTGDNFGNFVAKFRERGIFVAHKPYQAKIVLSFSGISFYWFLFKFLNKNKIDVLHIHRSNIYFAGIIAFLKGIPCIKTQHSVFYNKKITLSIAISRRMILRKFFNVKFHTIGESVYSHELNYYKNPTIKINNWFNPMRFYEPTGKEKANARDLLNITKNTFVIISVGGCSYIKNHHDILRAIAKLKNELDVLYLHLGQGVTECEEKELAKELGVENNVRFIGNKENVREYLIASDVYVMTSKGEGLSISCLEVMACKVPVILYNVMGLKDMIKENDNGFLIESNPMALADKIVLYANSELIRIEKSTSALAYVKANHDIYKNVNSILDLYSNKF
tara:strand:- start:1778 stop:2890 length:1113 start_codon:yes stop_codon:yes gene_type:complete